MLIGGGYRSWWENRRLKPIVEEVRLKEGGAAAEKKSAQMLLFTFMIAAGALTGEAFYGVESAVLAVVDDSFKDFGWWPVARLLSFLAINLALGALIYILFSKAGIIGGKGDERGSDKGGQTVLDAELAD